ncbi:MAG: hypothetical protein PHX61_05650 [Alphaproteobacteria bacterium]|nr:hypothetical protein [Alphaproteobacteria bacterium]
MTEGKAGQEVVLIEDNTETTVVRSGIRVIFNANGIIDIYGRVLVNLYDPAKDMEDGTIFGGISPDTNKPMYVRPTDEPLVMKWNQAMIYAARLEGYGRPAGTYRVPTEGELNVLFQNRARIGGFNETGSSPFGLYWSSTHDDNHYASDQRFSDGDRDWSRMGDYASVRLVRD